MPWSSYPVTFISILPLENSREIEGHMKVVGMAGLASGGWLSYFFNPTLLARFAIFRLVVTLVTVPMARYFDFTVSRIASRWS